MVHCIDERLLVDVEDSVGKNLLTVAAGEGVESQTSKKVKAHLGFPQMEMGEKTTIATL